MIRLDKFLTDHGFGTRSEVKETIRKGYVSIGDETCKKADTKFDPEKVTVTVHGQPIVYETFSYYMLNKPAGLITASTDPKAQTVMDLFRSEQRRDLFPVGRLDKDTVGLLLITNNGPLCHELLAPKSHVDKTYYVGLKYKLTDSDIRQLESGVDIGEKALTKPAKCSRTPFSPTESYSDAVLLTITEGKFHQVKKMFACVNNEVLYLKRISFGPLQLDESLAERPISKMHI